MFRCRAAGSCLGLGLTLALLLLGNEAQAVKVSVKDDIFINLNLLLQPWVQVNYLKGRSYPAGKGAGALPAADAPDTQGDFFLRRARIILGGQVSKWVSFFADTDMSNWGKGGVWTSKDYNGDGIVDATPASFVVQDAFVRLNLHPAFNISAGMLLVSFNRNFFTSAAKLHGTDYHVVMAKYPPGSNLVWRDNGVMLSGLLLKSKLEYRFSVTQGFGEAEDDLPRITGRISYNPLDTEGDVFPAGTYHGDKRVLSIGVAADLQPSSIKSANGLVGTYVGVTGDLFWDLPLGKNRRLTGLLGVLYYGANRYVAGGVGMLCDVGFAIGRFEPIVSVDWFIPRNGPDGFDGQMLHVHPGLNFWLHNHTANIKLDVGILRDAGTLSKNGVTVPNPRIETTIQTQLFF